MKEPSQEHTPQHKPFLQVLTHADTCHYMSLIDQHEKIHAMELQLQVAAMISQGATLPPLCSLSPLVCLTAEVHIIATIAAAALASSTWCPRTSSMSNQLPHTFGSNRHRNAVDRPM